MSEKPTAEDLQLELTKLNAAYASLQEELDSVLVVNDKLTHEIEKLYNEQKMCNCGRKVTPLSSIITSTQLASYTFAVDDQKYGFNFFKLTYKGQLITAIDVVASPELQRQLISSGSGMIKKIN